MLKQNTSILKLFSEQKRMHYSPPQMLNSYLHKGERPSLSSPFLRASIAVHSESKWVYEGEF